jgi:UDP-3-O-[3-hydroxymyristoyl] glucosamine N-acyltransferase
MLGTLAELAARVGGSVVGDASIEVARIAAIGEASDDALTFATDAHYLQAALESKAAAVLLDASLVPDAAAAKPLLAVPSARAAMVTLLQAFRAPRPRGPYRHPSAVVEDGATIADDAYLGALAFVGAGARIGRGSVIDVGAFVGAQTQVGDECWLQPRSSVMENCVLGDRVVLHNGCVIGSEGFGWAMVGANLERIPQVGNVVLEDDVEIGANTCVDRAQTGSTRIGAGTKIDNLCQIGHNCVIGKHCALAAMCGMAGSTTLGDYVQAGGSALFNGHITVGSRVTVAGHSEVWGDVASDTLVSGAPARPHRERLREQAQMRKVPKLFERVAALERERAADA